MIDTPLLIAEGVSVSFGGLHALQGLTFTVKAGEIVGLIGPNGAGKTTLFNALVGLQPLTAGNITLAGKTVSGLKPHRVAAQGMTKTFQNTALFPDMSVLENVMTAGLLHHDIKGAEDLARSVLARLGLTSIAGRDVADLTFPQKALVEMARALATKPKVLLLDEVMAALNHVEMDEIMAVIRSLRDDGLTVLIVEHHMRAIMSLCDRLLAVCFGRLIAEGSPQDVANDPKVVEAYLGHGPAHAEGASHA